LALLDMLAELFLAETHAPPPSAAPAAAAGSATPRSGDRLGSNTAAATMPRLAPPPR
jgi:hypothetical protein